MPSMVQSLTRLRSQEKARFDPERAPSEPRHIRHARAWGRCLDRVGAAVHRVTGIRLDSLRAWARPHDGDRESPTEKASRAMWAAIDSGMEWNDATAPLAELAADFGCSLQRLDIDEAPPRWKADPRLALWFDLVRPDDVIESAFNKTIAELKTKWPAEFFLGGFEG